MGQRPSRQAGNVSAVIKLAGQLAQDRPRDVEVVPGARLENSLHRRFDGSRLSHDSTPAPAGSIPGAIAADRVRRAIDGSNGDAPVASTVP